MACCRDRRARRRRSGFTLLEVLLSLSILAVVSGIILIVVMDGVFSVLYFYLGI